MRVPLHVTVQDKHFQHVSSILAVNGTLHQLHTSWIISAISDDDMATRFYNNSVPSYRGLWQFCVNHLIIGYISSSGSRL